MEEKRRHTQLKNKRNEKDWGCRYLWYLSGNCSKEVKRTIQVRTKQLRLRFQLRKSNNFKLRCLCLTRNLVRHSKNLLWLVRC